ncbi:chromatin assembly factor-I (CAF-I) p90 subunit [Arachnomyces sp. PD_36]|nr:chromatin assembly factor-I (CAF-I) p90 subunit [Arachnomyces sp. PD_36]
MDTMVESHIIQQPPMGEQTTRSVSPTGSRKRAFEEIEEAVVGSQKDAGIQPTDSTQVISTSIGGESISQPSLNGTSVNGIARTTTAPAPVPNGLENSPIESNSISTGTTSNSATTPAPIPIPTPKTPLSMPTMPNKKVKLSPASLEAKRIEKEIRDRQRAEEKARKEEEKRIREEEKKKRDEEREEERKKKEEEKKKRGEEREEERKKREEKKKAKEEERQAREEEKRKKEEEKSKKERSQMRLNAFFTKPSMNQATSSGAQGSSAGPEGDPASDSSGGGGRRSSGPCTTTTKPISDYQRDFPGFFVQSHTKIAPINRFGRDEDALRHLREKVDSIFSSKSDADNTPTHPSMPFRPAELFHIMPYKRRRGKQRLPSVKEILLKMQGSPSNPINLTEEKVPNNSNEDPKAILRKIRVKSLKFSEDVRPPYQGTFTRPIPEHSALRLSRNPFKREMPGINYDYDSEAEWEEPEEGEDLDSEGEEEMSDDGDEDMEGFLDDADEDQANPKRKMIVGDLEPTCSGLCWEDGSGADTDLSEYRMNIISDLPRFKFPIDPHSTSYWQTTPVTKNNAKSTIISNPAQKTNKPSDMQPPPLPHNGSGGTTLNLTAWASPKSNAQTSKTDPLLVNADGAQVQPSGPNNGKPKRQFPPEQLAELKGIVEGSDLTKTGLIEVVKKRFPKIPKGVLRDTVSDVAVRVGDKEADKKWVLKS